MAKDLLKHAKHLILKLCQLTLKKHSYLGEFQIDHVAISYPNHKEISNVQVRKGSNIDSDHYLTRIKLKLKP